MRRTLGLVVIGVASMAAACSGNGSSQESSGTEPRSTTVPAPTVVTAPTITAPTTTTAPLAVDRRTGVGVRTETYVDSSRPTSADGAFPGAPDRTFPVTIWYPTAGDPDGPTVPDTTPDRAGGPYPLVVFAHGYAVTPQFYEALLREWAAAGYVVAAPTYPLWSSSAGGGSNSDYEKSFADTSFVITQLVRDFAGSAASAETAGADPLAGTIDENRIGVAGHSNGEVVSYGVGFLQCCRDPHVQSVIAMAGNLSNISNPVEHDNGVPIMHLLGEADELQPYAAAIAYDHEQLDAPKWSVTLVNGAHTPPYRSPSSPHFAGVVAITTDFWNGTLKDRPDRLAGIDAAVADAPGLFRLER